MVCGQPLLGSYGIEFWEMPVASIAIVAALRETSVLFGALIAIFFLKEPLRAGRVAATLMIMAGLALIRLYLAVIGVSAGRRVHEFGTGIRCPRSVPRKRSRSSGRSKSQRLIGSPQVRPRSLRRRRVSPTMLGAPHRISEKTARSGARIPIST